MNLQMGHVAGLGLSLPPVDLGSKCHPTSQGRTGVANIRGGGAVGARGGLRPSGEAEKL